MKAKNNMNRKTIKSLSIIISFLQSIFISVLLTSILINISLFHEKTIINNLERTNYYNDLQNYLINDLEDLLIPTGLSFEVLDQVIEKEELKQSINKYIKEVLNNNQTEIETINIEQRLRNNINNYLNQLGIKENDIDPEIINTIVKTINEEYISIIKFPYLNQIVNIIEIYNKLMYVIIIISLIMIIISNILLYRINKWKHRYYKYTSYSIGASGLMLLLLPLYLLIKSTYKKLSLRPEYIYNFIVKHIDNSLKLFILTAIILIIIQIILIVIENKKKHKLLIKK